MSGHTIPTDSALRRHFEQHAASRGLPPPPEDSVLRRHYLQMLNAGGATINPSPTAKPAAAAKPAPAAAPSPAPVAPSGAALESAGAGGAEQPQGFFARLMAKLFGK